MKHTISILIAWILWIHTQAPKTDSWTQISGFVGEKQCIENLDEKLGTWKAFKDARFNGNSVTFAGSKTTVTYLCLPENEAPRKAEARKRPPAKR
ncbi:MAG: hypothetical protein FJ145_18840 [Deltaproteobacteria bacterium]|nr:hypothetical protein [Deltaproteobacteria bacterium]